LLGVVVDGAGESTHWSPASGYAVERRVAMNFYSKVFLGLELRVAVFYLGILIWVLIGPMAHHYATNVWGGKDKRANTHTKRTLAKLGKSVRNYGCEADIGRKKDVQPIPQKVTGLGPRVRIT
jgi:hypothetical protein